jgi:hypothetical protein
MLEERREAEGNGDVSKQYKHVMPGTAEDVSFGPQTGHGDADRL